MTIKGKAKKRKWECGVCRSPLHQHPRCSRCGHFTWCTERLQEAPGIHIDCYRRMIG